MKTYLLVRTPHVDGGFVFGVLAETSLLGWFRDQGSGEGLSEAAAEAFDQAYGLSGFFDGIDDELPEDDDALVEFIYQHLYSEGGHHVEAHFVHVETDDDENSIEYFLFDEAFLDHHGAVDQLPDPATFEESPRRHRYVRFLEQRLGFAWG